MSSRKKLAVFLGAAVFLMAGCGATELEERCFPQLVLAGYENGQVAYCAGFPRVGSSSEKEPQISEIQVDTVYAKSFAESRAEYEGHLNKTADYNHLKVLVFEEDLLEEQDAYNGMLDSLANTEVFPRNTYVCVINDMEELRAIDQNLPQDLGTYLEEYLKNHEEKKERLLTLGDLIDEKANQEMVLYMPYLEVEENYVEWGGYYTVGMPPIQMN